MNYGWCCVLGRARKKEKERICVVFASLICRNESYGNNSRDKKTYTLNKAWFTKEKMEK